MLKVTTDKIFPPSVFPPLRKRPGRRRPGHGTCTRFKYCVGYSSTETRSVLIWSPAYYIHDNFIIATVSPRKTLVTFFYTLPPKNCGMRQNRARLTNRSYKNLEFLFLELEISRSAARGANQIVSSPIRSTHSHGLRPPPFFRTASGTRRSDYRDNSAVCERQLRRLPRNRALRRRHIFIISLSLKSLIQQLISNPPRSPRVNNRRLHILKFIQNMLTLSKL